MNQKTRVRGFSLIEIMIAVAILAGLMLMVYMSLFRTTDMYSANSKRAWILHQARSAIDEIAEELRQANRLNLKPTIVTSEGVEAVTPSTTISFIKITSPDPVTNKVRYNTYYTSYFAQRNDTGNITVDPGNAVLPASPAPQLPWKLSAGGWVDANNNAKKVGGVVTGMDDDYRLVRTDPNPDANGHYYPAKVMCNYVKKDGFSIYQTWRTVSGRPQYQLRISLVLQFVDERNKQLEETVETTVFLRNSQ
jgi:prepilin-type N-terminal cleavage/methylation domain-containing protein